MVGRTLITSPLFSTKGKLSPTLKQNLLVRGGGVMVNDLLKRFGVAEGSPVVATVVTLDPGTGAIKGMRYETRGKGPEVCFKAGELWPDVAENIQMKIKLSDLSVLRWLTVGERRNQTEWMSGEELETEAVHSEHGILSKAQLENYNVKDFVVRFTILPVGVSSVFSTGGSSLSPRRNSLRRWAAWSLSCRLHPYQRSP